MKFRSALIRLTAFFAVSTIHAQLPLKKEATSTLVPPKTVVPSAEPIRQSPDKLTLPRKNPETTSSLQPPSATSAMVPPPTKPAIRELKSFALLEPEPKPVVEATQPPVKNPSLPPPPSKPETPAKPFKPELKTVVETTPPPVKYPSLPPLPSKPETPPKPFKPELKTVVETTPPPVKNPSLPPLPSKPETPPKPFKPELKPVVETTQPPVKNPPIPTQPIKLELAAKIGSASIPIDTAPKETTVISNASATPKIVERPILFAKGHIPLQDLPKDPKTLPPPAPPTIKYDLLIVSDERQRIPEPTAVLSIQPSYTKPETTLPAPVDQIAPPVPAPPTSQPEIPDSDLEAEALAKEVAAILAKDAEHNSRQTAYAKAPRPLIMKLPSERYLTEATKHLQTMPVEERPLAFQSIIQKYRAMRDAERESMRKRR